MRTLANYLMIATKADLKAAGSPGLTKGLELDGLPMLEGLRTGAQVIFVFVFAQAGMRIIDAFICQQT